MFKTLLAERRRKRSRRRLSCRRAAQIRVRIRDAGPGRTDFHRTVSNYVNGVIARGCRIDELVEPTLPVSIEASGEHGPDPHEVPRFLVIAATKTETTGVS